MPIHTMLRLALVALVCSTSIALDDINAFYEARAKIAADRTYDEIKYAVVQQDIAKMIGENSLEKSLDAPIPSSDSSTAPASSPLKKGGLKGAKGSKTVLSTLGGKEACKKSKGADCVVTLSSKTGLNGTVTLNLAAPAVSPSASKKGSDKKSEKNVSSLYETSAPVGPSNALNARAAEPSASAVSPNWASPAASPASWAPVTWAPVTWAPVTWAPVTWAPVTWAPVTSTTTSAPLATTAPSTSGAPMIQSASSGDRLSVDTIPLELKMSGDFDIAVDDDAIFKAIEQQLTEYLTQAVPYLLSFDLDVKFEPTPPTNQTLIEGADTSNVAMACLTVTMHLVSDKDGELQDFTDIVATDILCKFFQGSTLQVLLSAIVDRGVDMSFLEIVVDTSSKLTVEDDVAIISESAEPQSIKEDVKSNTGYISAMIGGSCVLAIGVAAFMRVGRKQKDVDDSQDEKHHDYQEEDLEVRNDGRKNSGPTFPDLLPINFKSYVDRRRHDDDDDDSIDISLMDGPDLIASNCKDLSPLTQKSALSDAIRMNLKRMSTSSEGFECTVNGDMMFSVDLL